MQQSPYNKTSTCPLSKSCIFSILTSCQSASVLDAHPPVECLFAGQESLEWKRQFGGFCQAASTISSTNPSSTGQGHIQTLPNLSQTSCPYCLHYVLLSRLIIHLTYKCENIKISKIVNFVGENMHINKIHFITSMLTNKKLPFWMQELLSDNGPPTFLVAGERYKNLGIIGKGYSAAVFKVSLDPPL